MFYDSWGLNFNTFAMMNPYASFGSLRMYCPADRFVMPDSYFGGINPFMFNPYMMRFKLIQSMTNSIFNNTFSQGCRCQHNHNNVQVIQNVDIPTDLPEQEDLPKISLESRLALFEENAENIFTKNYETAKKDYETAPKNILVKKSSVSSNVFVKSPNKSPSKISNKTLNTTSSKTLKSSSVSQKSVSPNVSKPTNKKIIQISNKQIASIVHEKAQKYGVDENLILAMISQESSFNNNTTSYKGAKGLMQLMPATARELGVTDVRDPEQNIDAGVRYMKQLLDRYRGNVKLALAAYNAGAGNVQKYGGIPPFRETRNYVNKIYDKYKNASLA